VLQQATLMIAEIQSQSQDWGMQGMERYMFAEGGSHFVSLSHTIIS
jgi:hypothetical protein